MKKVVITAFDITTARRAGQTSIAVPENALVTPQAADDARDYGIALVIAPACGVSSAVPPVSGPEQAVSGHPGFSPRVVTGSAARVVAGSVTRSVTRSVTGAATTPVAAEVRRLILARLGGAAPASLDAVIGDVLAGSKAARPQNTGGVVFASSATAALRQASPSTTGAIDMIEAVPPGSSTPGVAYMAWENSSFSWVFPQAEVLVVLEGEITVTANGEARTGKGGDTFIIPAGTEATLSAVGTARCVHSSWPNLETAKG